MTDAGVVIVGASLAGLHTAEHLRILGWRGSITLVGDEPEPPYDRPPLSKSVLSGTAAPTAPLLTRSADLDVTWRLGTVATGLDRASRRILLADGDSVAYDRLVIATGRRARPWIPVADARLTGVVTLRGIGDALELRAALATRTRRVVIVGAGFIGSEVASVARELGHDVSVIARGRTPLDGALGERVGSFASDLFERNGVDLHTATLVSGIRGDDVGHVASVDLDDGSHLEADLVVIATGSLPNVEWLDGSGLDVAGGVAVDGRMNALDLDGVPCREIFAAGDVTRWRHPLAGDRLLAIEHWGNAVEQGRQAARAIAADAAGGADVDAFAELPRFWSTIFGTNIKSIGIPSVGDEIAVAQGSLSDRRGVILYGSRGRTVAAVAIDSPRELEFYESLVERAAPFPPRLVVADWAGDEPPAPVAAGFPRRGPLAVEHEILI